MARKDKILERDTDHLTPEQQERVNLVEEKSQDGEHVGEDLLSYTQLAYYAGHQYIALNRANRTIIPLPKEPWEVQYTANRIMPAVRTELAKVMRNRLTKKVVPASSDDEDIRAAKTADGVVEWLEYDKKLQQLDEDVVLWTLVTRIGFVKVMWDPSAGALIGYNSEEPGMDEEGNPMYAKKKEIREGDVAFEVLNLFEVKWDPAASKFEDTRWVIHERQRNVKYVKDMYGVDVPPEEDLTSSSIYQTKLGTITAEAFNTTPIKAKDQVTVKEYWEMPCDEYPKGRKITVAAGKELDYVDDIGFGEEDDTERQLPIFHLLHIPIPGKVVGSAVTEQLMPIQKEYNRSRSQIINHKNLMAYPTWVAEEGSCDEIPTAPGSIVWYKKGFNAPSRPPVPPMGSDIYKNIESCIEEFRTISGQQEVTQGTAPTGVSSGVAIQLLQEQDDTKMAPTVAKYSRFKQKYLSYALKVIRYKYDAERTVQLVGTNNRIETLSFKGSDLTSTDVRMEDQSLTQLTSAARKQYIMELITAGVLNPQMDKDLIIRMLELGITDEMYDAAEVDVQQALNENAAWADQDFSPIVRDFYNHEVHLFQHNKFRKGEEYESLPEEAKQLVDKHIDEHQLYIMQELQGGPAPAPSEPGAEEQLDLDKVMGALSPEEQAALQANPQILDSI